VCLVVFVEQFDEPVHVRHPGEHLCAVFVVMSDLDPRCSQVGASSVQDLSCDGPVHARVGDECVCEASVSGELAGDDW
jgi:hypothetical protein